MRTSIERSTGIRVWCTTCMYAQKHSRKQSDVMLKSSAKQAGSLPRTAVNSASFAHVALIVFIFSTTRHVHTEPPPPPGPAHFPPACVLYHSPPTSWLALYFYQSYLDDDLPGLRPAYRSVQFATPTADDNVDVMNKTSMSWDGSPRWCINTVCPPPFVHTIH